MRRGLDYSADGWTWDNFLQTAVNPQSAWTFSEYANSVAGRTVLPLISVAESDAFLNPNQLPSRINIWLDTIPTLQIVPAISNWQEVESTASGEIECAFYGNTTVEEVANLAFTRTEEYFQLGISNKN